MSSLINLNEITFEEEVINNKGIVIVDENPSLAGQFGIKSIPTMVVFENGIRVDQVVGLRPKEEIKEKLAAY